MCFRSTLVITFLVSILALLASVRAEPSSGLRSRGDNSPFSIHWITPKKNEQVNRGSNLILKFTVMREHADPPPPYPVLFQISNALPAVSERQDLVTTNLVPAGANDPVFVHVNIPKDMFTGAAVILCNYRHSYSAHASAYTIRAGCHINLEPQDVA